MTTPTVGYIGLDHHHCEPYLRSLDQLPVEITCACEPNQSFEIDSVGGLEYVPIYRDPEELIIQEDVDVVWVTLSNRDTPATIRTAVKSGVDVFTEKPAARTADELRDVAALVNSSDATVCVSYPWRMHPIATELREQARGGFFGDIRAFELRFVASQLAYRDTSHTLFDRDASRGGILQWLGVHWVDLIAHILNDPIERVNSSLTQHSDAIDIEDGCVLQLETASGAVGTLQCGYYLREGRYDTNISIYGTRGRAEWDPIGREFGFDDQTELTLETTGDEWTSTPQRTIVHEYNPAPGYGGRWGLEFIETFFEARNGDTPVSVTLDDAMHVLCVLDAAYESAERDQWMTISETETLDPGAMRSTSGDPSRNDPSSLPEDDA
jgi:predicted dehydrogenase